MDDTLHIRPATEDDMRRCADIFRSASLDGVLNFSNGEEGPDWWRALWRRTHESYPWLVAESGDGVQGFAHAEPHKARAAYAWTVSTTIYLAPEVQGRGLGRRLYTALLDGLRAQGFHLAVAGISSPHPASEGLHEALGFTRYGYAEGIGYKHGAWRDVSYWALSLDPATPPREIGPPQLP